MNTIDFQTFVLYNRLKDIFLSKLILISVWTQLYLNYNDLCVLFYTVVLVLVDIFVCLFMSIFLGNQSRIYMCQGTLRTFSIFQIIMRNSAPL